MADDLDIRLLRYFVVVADELHFTRAAQRLFVAQQALSRDIRRLEERLGLTLFERTTRRMTLTAAGERFLGRARQIVALHDEAIAEARSEQPRLLVDVIAEHLAPARMLSKAREYSRGGVGFYARFHTGGLDGVLHQLRTQQVDVAFGRRDWSGLDPTDLPHRLVRLEPLALLLADDHPLAALDSVPLSELRGLWVCPLVGHHASPEWQDAGTQLLQEYGAQTTLNHPQVMGAEETARHLHDRRTVLTLASQPTMPGVVVRPLVDPVPLYPWSMVWRSELDHPGLGALHQAADALAADEGWLDRPPGAWLPKPEAAILDAG